MKVIKKNQVEIIKGIAKEFAKLEKGSRQSAKREAIEFLKLCDHHKSRKEVELKLNKEYKLIMTEKVNLGTSKWGDWYTDYRINTCTFTGETDCYYIDKDSRKYRKDKIDYIIEE